MSKAAFRIAYDGEALVSHTMDVRDLAPALLGMGEIFVEANRILNGKDTHVEVHVTPKIEENCFDIGLEIWQQWEAIKNLLGGSDVVAAKDLVDWILFGGSGGYGLIIVYRKLKGRKPINVIRFNDENGNTLYRYQFDDGEPDQIVDEYVHRLYESSKIRTQLARLLRPLIQRSGVQEFTAYREGDKEGGTRLTKDDARGIDFTASEPEVLDPPKSTEEPIEAMLRVYSPVYDLNAPRWRFWYGKEHHYMNVAESNIREVVLNNGGALIDDRFRVLLEITERPNDAGEPTTEYKVLEVLDFIPAFRQPDMFHGQQGTDDSEEGSENGQS